MISQKEYDMELMEKADRQSGERATEKIHNQGKSISHTIDSVTHTAQKTFQETKKSARVAIGKVVDGLDTSTEYFTARGMEGVVEDAATLIRRHPFQALMLGLSIGYLLSRSRQQ